MTLESVTTISNVSTLAILLFGAMVAAIQFRHIRAGNALAAVLEVDRRFSDPGLQHALLYVQNALTPMLERPEYRAGLATRGYVDPQTHPEMLVCQWFDELGTMAEGGFLDEDIFFDSFGRLVEYYWRLLVPVVALLRRERGPDQYENLERLAARAEHWRVRHRRGMYGDAAGRMPPPDPWAA